MPATIPGDSIRAPSMQRAMAGPVAARAARLTAAAGDGAGGVRSRRKFGPCCETRSAGSGLAEPASTAITS